MIPFLRLNAHSNIPSESRSFRHRQRLLGCHIAGRRGGHLPRRIGPVRGDDALVPNRHLTRPWCILVWTTVACIASYAEACHRPSGNTALHGAPGLMIREAQATSIFSRQTGRRRGVDEVRQFNHLTSPFNAYRCARSCAYLSSLSTCPLRYMDDGARLRAARLIKSGIDRTPIANDCGVA